MQLLDGERLEPLGDGFGVIVSPHHTFNTDSVLLSAWSMPAKGERCAELGTGCGIVSLLWCARGKPAHVYAIEKQEEAAFQAARSARYNGFSNLHVCVLDVRTIPFEKPKTLPVPLELDRVACNPPYKPLGTGFPNPEGEKAAARHECACTFSEMAAAARRLLRWGGRFSCCLRPERLPEVLAVCEEMGLAPKRLRFVQHRLEKPPKLFLLECRRGGKPGGLSVEPVLLLEDPPGTCSPEMRAIYGAYADGHK